MNEYQLIEFTSKKNVVKIYTDKSKLDEILTEFYKDKMESLFDERGKSKGFVSIFLNAHQLFSIYDITLNNHDEIHVVSSIAGG